MSRVQCLGAALAPVLQIPEWVLGNGVTGVRWPGPTTRQERIPLKRFCLNVIRAGSEVCVRNHEVAAWWRDADDHWVQTVFHLMSHARHPLAKQCLRTQAKDVLRTYRSRCPFRVIMGAHVAPEHVSKPNMARKAPVSSPPSPSSKTDHGKSVLVFVCSASVEVVSSSSFDVCQTPGMMRKMGQHVFAQSVLATLSSSVVDFVRLEINRRRKNMLFSADPSHDHRHTPRDYETGVANITLNGPPIDTTEISTRNHDCRNTCVVLPSLHTVVATTEDVLTSAMTERSFT